MLPEIKFFRPEINIFLTGIGVRRDGADWQYYLPFKPVGKQPYADGDYPRSDVEFALPLSDSRAFAMTDRGELALIDLIADQVVVRKKIKHLPYNVQSSADRSQLFIHSMYDLYVLDATTLETIQHWYEIERTGGGWVRYTAAESRDIRQKKIAEGTLDAMHTQGPIRELGGGRLEAPFSWYGRGYYRPPSRSGFCVLDFATGAVERNQDASLPDAAHLFPPPDASQLGRTGDTYTSTGPAGFQALVAREAMVNLVVANDSLDAALAVLDDLAGRMERDLNALICCECIHLRFVLDGKTLEAGEFFDRFVRERCFEAVPILRRLMLAYLNNIGGGEGDMPWSYGGQAPLAMRALVLLDADVHDVFRLYLDKGDLEHDESPYQLFAEYLDRHGIRNEAGIRFGIYLTIMGCTCIDTDPSALLDGAARHVTPERFADLAIEEAKRISDDYWTLCGGNYVKYLDKRRNTTFSRKVIEILTSRV